MLHRIKKHNDLNQDKWVGIGGKFEDKESPEDCNKREVYEETGLTLDEDGIPETADGRIKIAEKIYKKAAEYGIDKKDIIYADVLHKMLSFLWGDEL